MPLGPIVNLDHVISIERTTFSEDFTDLKFYYMLFKTHKEDIIWSYEEKSDADHDYEVLLRIAKNIGKTDLSGMATYEPI